MVLHSISVRCHIYITTPYQALTRTTKSVQATSISVSDQEVLGPMNAEEFLRFKTKSQMFKEVVLIAVSKDCVTPWPIQIGPHALGAYAVLGARHS